jgi:hypothetical protein
LSVEENEMQKWQHCKLEGSKIHYLGAAGVFDNKADSRISQRTAWSMLENEGWELISAVMNNDGEIEYFFKRPEPPKA